ncbi:hypothetical protein LEN26_016783 [Aphanomyces euteiches]|nr:hypothetical protein LEN26_016783 [Aphanomyces euteiches]KAH9123650.1 hypothetical protein AeMF1_005423 [Aphanomyces euteiches]KAH9180166.1 hypothetical protein AeNC1_017190 [Aphanomyces euteiches]
MPLSYTQEEYMDFLKQTSFTPKAGLEKKDVKILLDWFMTKGFKINRDICNEGFLGGTRSTNDKVGHMFDVFKNQDPGVYIMQTEDISNMGHFWTV